MNDTDFAATGYIVDPVQVVWLGGADRLDFLQRMSTNRLVDLQPGQGRATVVVSDTGRVIDLVACHEGEAGAALITSGVGAAGAVTAQLRRYVLYGDDVRATDAGSQVSVIRIVGPAAVVVAAASGIDDASGLGPGDWVAAGEGPDTVWLMRHPRPGGLEGFDIVVPAGDPAAAMADRVAAAGASPWNGVRYDALRVAAGLPAWGAEFGGNGDSGANPLELGLKHAVDFAKGCYVGQEVIARLENYERVQRQLVRLRCAGPVAAGDAVSPMVPDARRRAGRITTAVLGEDGWHALALVPTPWLAEPYLEVAAVAGATRATIG